MKTCKYGLSVDVKFNYGTELYIKHLYFKLKNRLFK